MKQRSRMWQLPLGDAPRELRAGVPSPAGCAGPAYESADLYPGQFLPVSCLEAVTVMSS